MLDIVDTIAPADPFRRLATAVAAAAVGVPAFVYGVFALTWSIQRWLYVGRVGSVAVLLFSVLALATAHSLARDVSRAADGTERTTATSSDAESRADEAPTATLKRRYAAGEIGDEEFERKVERLVELDQETSDGTETGDPLVETE